MFRMCDNEKYTFSRGHCDNEKYMFPGARESGSSDNEKCTEIWEQ